MTSYLQAVVTGLGIGAVYALLAMGLTLIFGVMNVINFAHGALMMVAMFVTYWQFDRLGWSPYIGLPLAVAVAAGIGALMQGLVLERAMGAPEENFLLITFGLGLVIINVMQLAVGSDIRNIDVSVSVSSLKIGDITVSTARLIGIAIMVVVGGLLHFVLNRTYFGMSVRAVSQQPDAAASCGISLRGVRMQTFAIGAGLAGLAGVVLSPVHYIAPYAGESFTLVAFIAVVLGGLGNVMGALWASLLIGIAESVGAVALPGSLKQVMIYIVFIGVLMWRPQGIFGRAPAL